MRNCSFLFCDFGLEGYDNTYTKDVFTGEDPIGRYCSAKLRPGLHALGTLVISDDVFRTIPRLRFEKGCIYRIDYTGGREFNIQRMRLDGTGLETTTVRK